MDTIRSIGAQIVSSWSFAKAEGTAKLTSKIKQVAKATFESMAVKVAKTVGSCILLAVLAAICPIGWIVIAKPVNALKVQKKQR